MRRLYAYLPSTDQPIEFASVTNGEVRLTSLPDAKAAGKAEVVFFVSATDVACHIVRLGGQKASDLKRTAEFALEEDLAAPIEDTHFAIGNKGSGGRYPVHAVDPALMEEWIDRIHALGFPDAKLVADASVLPGIATAFETSDTYLVAFPDQSFALDASLPDDALQAVFAKASATLEVTGENLAARLGVTSQGNATLPPIAQLAIWADALPSLTNLHQGAYAAKRELNLDIQQWKLPAALLGAIALLFTSGLFVENYNLERLNTAMQQQGRDIYAAQHPGEPVPANLAQSIQTQPQKSNTPKLDFLNATALLYSALPNDESHAIRGLRFNSENGRLVASMTYPQYGADIDLKRELESKGLIVTLGDSRQQDGMVLGDVTMEASQ